MEKATSFGYIENNEVYLNDWSGNGTRVIGSVREEGIQPTIDYYVMRFQQLTEKVNEVEKNVTENENKGSYLVHIKHLRSLLHKYDGLGDYKVLDDRLIELEKILEDIVALNRIKNTQVKQELLLELKNAIEQKTWKEATDLILDIKSRWIKTGKADDAINEEMDESFFKEVNGFFDRKKVYYDDKRKLQEIKLEKYAQIIEKARNLAGVFDLMKVKDQFDKLEEEWKEVGIVNAKVLEPHLKEFKNIQRDFKSRHDRQVRDSRSNDPESIEINTREKIDLVDEIQQLDEKFYQLRYKLDINKLKDKWLQIGKADRDKEAMLNRNFFNHFNRIQERQFVDGAILKRDRMFFKKDERSKCIQRIRTMEYLLDKDEKMLESFGENIDKFQVNRATFKDMATKRYEQQKTKVEIKKQLLVELRAMLNKLPKDQPSDHSY